MKAETASTFERLLIIDDDIALCDMLSEYLEAEGYDPYCTADARKGGDLAISGDFSLVVLDVMLPKASGFDVLRRIREESAIPVLMLTARGDDVDRIVGLEAGADDYLPKPFNPRELVARLRAILRRTQADQASSSRASGPLLIGDVRLDPGRRQVWRADTQVSLTSLEFDLMAYLMRRAGEPVSREVLTRELLDRRFNPLDRSIDVHIGNLRRKLQCKDNSEDLIKTIRGVGYMFVRI